MLDFLEQRMPFRPDFVIHDWIKSTDKYQTFPVTHFSYFLRKLKLPAYHIPVP